MYKLPQLVDIVPVSFSPVGEDPTQLRVLRAEKKLSLRQLSKTTGHSISYLQQQLRKFGIDPITGNTHIAPYGWDGTGTALVKNPKEQRTLGEMKKLYRAGLGFEAVANELNRQGIAAKNGGRWWAASVSKILRRELKGPQS